MDGIDVRVLMIYSRGIMVGFSHGDRFGMYMVVTRRNEGPSLASLRRLKRRIDKFRMVGKQHKLLNNYCGNLVLSSHRNERG